MKVKIRAFARLRELMKNRELEVELEDGATVNELLRKLVEMYGEKLNEYLFSRDGSLKDHFVIYINGVGLKEAGGICRSLRDGDVVAILPPISGG